MNVTDDIAAMTFMWRSDRGRQYKDGALERIKKTAREEVLRTGAHKEEDIINLMIKAFAAEEGMSEHV